MQFDRDALEQALASVERGRMKRGDTLGDAARAADVDLVYQMIVDSHDGLDHGRLVACLAEIDARARESSDAAAAGVPPEALAEWFRTRMTQAWALSVAMLYAAGLPATSGERRR